MKKITLLLLVTSIFAANVFAQTKTMSATGTGCNQYLKVGSTYTIIGKDGSQTKATIARLDPDGKVILKSKPGTTVAVSIGRCEGTQKNAFWDVVIWLIVELPKIIKDLLP